MRSLTITKEYELYKYEELTDDAKKNVKQWILDDDLRSDIFYEDCLYKLEELFPNSNLKLEYSLCYCQGDGLNIVGELDLNDLLENVKDKLTEKQYRFIKFVIGEIDCIMKLNYNNYGYYFKEKDFEGKLLDIDCNYIYYKNLNYEIMKLFDSIANDYLKKLAKKFENDGYEYIYNISEEEAQEFCDMNGYEFTEEGIIFFDK